MGRYIINIIFSPGAEYANAVSWAVEKNNVFIAGNTYEVIVPIFISDIAQGKSAHTSGGLKINSFPIESYKMYANDKGIEMSVTYVCGEKKVKENTISSESSEKGEKIML